MKDYIIEECYCLKKHKWMDENSYIICYECDECLTQSSFNKYGTFKKMESKDKYSQRLKKINKL